MNLIEAAVLPLKNDAMERAGNYARDLVRQVTEDLAAHNNDIHVAAPYPRGVWDRNKYAAIMRKVKLYEAVTTWREGQIVRPNSTCFVDVDAAKVEKFVQEARENAAYQYDAFVAKLNDKIGIVTEAKLEGNHVWGYSHLRVVTIAGVRETWKTQTIINTSKLGKVFNQYPTRRVKY